MLLVWRSRHGMRTGNCYDVSPSDIVRHITSTEVSLVRLLGPSHIRNAVAGGATSSHLAQHLTWFSWKWLYGPGHLRLVTLKPVSRMSILGEFYLPRWFPGCFLELPFCTSKQGVVGSWLGIARKRLGILRTEKSPKTGRADGGVCCDWVWV